MKRYYVIYKIYHIGVDYDGHDLVSRQHMCIVEDEEIAQDFCSKYSDYNYFEEIINVVDNTH